MPNGRGTDTTLTSNTATENAGIDAKGTAPAAYPVPPTSASRPPAAPWSTYVIGPNSGPIGTLVHKIVLRVLSARLFAIALDNRIERPAPGGSKRVWSDYSGYIDLVVLLHNPQQPLHVEAQLYELKPNHPSEYQTYVSEVEHYSEYLPRTFELMRVDHALRGKILHFVRRVAPNVFDSIVFLSTVVDIFINFWPATDNRGPVDGLIVYEWGYRSKQGLDEQVALAQHMADVKRLLRVQSKPNPAAQRAREELIAADIVLAFTGIGLLMSIFGSSAAGIGVELGVAGGTAAVAAATVAIPAAVTGVSSGTVISVSPTALITASTTVANDIAPLAAALVAYFAGSRPTQSQPSNK